MQKLEIFTFNPFSENTYLIYEEGGEACLIDPGCSNSTEQSILKKFLKEKELRVTSLILTHAHIDHIMGYDWAASEFKLVARCHPLEESVFKSGVQTSILYNLPYTEGPKPTFDLQQGMVLNLAGQDWEIRETPGHSPGSVVLINHLMKWVIAGDVLFQGSIGRTDLPGGNHDTLLKSISQQLYSLPDDYKVYPGHGLFTTIGYEKQNNPYIRAT